MIAPTAKFREHTAASRLNTQSLVLKILILGAYFFFFHLSTWIINNLRFYNKTNFSGLETHILNSYTNAVVQVMHYVSPIRRLAKAHILIDCPREHCFFCELGFVFRMLEDAQGTNCQASNFCKTVGVLAQGFSGCRTILPYSNSLSYSFQCHRAHWLWLRSRWSRLHTEDSSILPISCRPSEFWRQCLPSQSLSFTSRFPLSISFTCTHQSTYWRRWKEYHNLLSLQRCQRKG